MPERFTKNYLAMLLPVLTLLLVFTSAIYAQSNENLETMKSKAAGLIQQQKFTEALPLLEKIVVAEPANPQIQFYLGFALLGQSKTISDSAAQTALRIRARNAFIKAKELGITEPIIDALIQGIPADGSDGESFSQNKEANKLMKEAESFFSQGKLEDALKSYQKALQLDPKIYEAALFSADVYMNKNDFEKAEIWYQKAIAIDPDRETAYRYSATPLMKQGKTDAARDRYIQGYLAEPFGKKGVAGLIQWGQATKSQLAHPQIEIPLNVSQDAKGGSKIDIPASALLTGAQDGSFAWMAYGATRAEWSKGKFSRSFPNEKNYRHSLAEEADAIRSVLAIATEDKKIKSLSPTLSALKQLNDAGVLEAYILLARADQGIAQDYPAYRQQNRDKLVRYVLDFVISKNKK